MKVALICIPATWHINRQYFILKRLQLRYEIFIGLPDLSCEGKAKDRVNYQTFILEVFYKYLLNFSVLFEILGAEARNLVEIT